MSSFEIENDIVKKGFILPCEVRAYKLSLTIKLKLSGLMGTFGTTISDQKAG